MLPPYYEPSLACIVQFSRIFFAWSCVIEVDGHSSLSWLCTDSSEAHKWAMRELSCTRPA